jgi:DNA-binding transcriptional MerR regulator
LDIGQVARRTGRAPSALRFYERKGLIRSVDRKGLRRLFEPAVLDQVALIVAGQEAGFELDELHKLINHDATGPESRQMMQRKATEIDEKIERLTEVRDRLQHAAHCNAPHLLECETFLACVRAALPPTPPP